jgi:hypothetical protein
MSPLASILAEANRQAPTPVPTSVQPTNVAGIYANHDQQAMDAYKAELAQQNAMFGGLASLGSAGISALPKLLGSGGAAAGAADIGGSAMSSLLSTLGSAAIL